MPFIIEKGDLVKKEIDCMVNASNVNLRMVEGVGRAIFHKAGDEVLAKACRDIGHCDVGDAVTTPAFGIENTKMIIHAVAPVYINGKHDEEKNLRSAYRKALSLCLENNFKSIAFPLLSGEFNYPLDECLDIAIDETKEFLKDNNDIFVYLVMYKNFPEFLNDTEATELKKYLINSKSIQFKTESTTKFLPTLKRKITASKLSNEELALKANISVATLKRILKDDKEVVNKNMIVSLAVALELSKEELNNLLVAKELFLEASNIEDMIICYHLDNKIYDIYHVNKSLLYYGYNTLNQEIYEKAEN